MANAIISLVLKAKDQASGVINGTIGRLGALAAVVAGGLAINKVMDDLTKLDHQAQKLSISVEKLTQAQYAASLTSAVGADEFYELLHKSTMEIEKFSAKDAGKAGDFFKAINKDASEFVKLDPVDQILAISDAMKGMSTSAKDNFLKQLGGTGLQKLLTTLKNGSDEMRSLMQQSKDFNLEISRFDAKAVTSLADTFSDLTSILEGSFRKSFASIAPELETIVIMLREHFISAATDASGSIKNLGSVLGDTMKSMLGTISFMMRFKASLQMIFHAVSGSVLMFVEVFLRGFQAIGNGIAESMNWISNTLKSSFSGFLRLVDNALIKPLSALYGSLPGFEAGERGLKRLSEKVREYAISVNNSKAFIEVQNIDPTIKKIKDLKDESFALAGKKVDLIIEIAAGEKNLGDVYDETLKSKRKALQDAVDQNAADAEENKQLSGTVDIAKASSDAAQKIHETQAKLRADLLRADIESAITRIDTQKQIQLAGLEERARIEELSAVSIADMRYKIELDAAKKTSEQQKKLIQTDIDLLKKQLENVRKTPGNQSEIASAIVEIEAEITLKKREQVKIGAELVAQSAILRAGRAAELETIRVELEQIKKDAEIELKAVRGDTVGAELDRVERQFKDTIKKMEELGVDSEAVKSLVSASKAKIEMDEIERQYAALRKRLAKNEISPFDYMKEAAELEKRGQKAAETTGNSDDLERMKDSAKAARAEIFDMGTLIDTTKDSMTSGLEGLFGDFISGSKSAKEAFSDFAQSVLMDIGKMIGRLMAQLAIQTLLSAFSGGTSSTAGAMSGILKMGMNHSGGRPGRSGMNRYIPLSAFLSPEYHHGGGKAGFGSTMPGLKSNEVASILLKNEEVLTADDPRHIDNLSKGRAGKTQDKQPITVVNMLDNSAIARAALESPEGERMVLNIINANKSSLGM